MRFYIVTLILSLFCGCYCAQEVPTETTEECLLSCEGEDCFSCPNACIEDNLSYGLEPDGPHSVQCWEPFYLDGTLDESLFCERYTDYYLCHE